MTEEKKNQKKARAEVKIFTVPFPMGEIKEKNSIATNAPSRPSKEQLINQAFKFHSAGNISEASKYYQLFINQGFKDHRVFSNFGSILINLGKLKEAEVLTRKAIALKPDFPDAHSNLGLILRALGNSKEAESSYREAIELDPNYAIGHYNLGNILRDLGKSKDAEFSYRKAIEIKPDYAEAHYNLGNTLRDLGDFFDAINNYKQALKLNSKLSSAKAALIETKGYICDYSDQDIQNIWLKNLGIEGQSVSPFGLLYYEDNPLNHLKRSQKYYEENYICPKKKIKASKKSIIHIGYFSANFRTHPVMYVIKRILELHDSSKFKVFIYSFAKIEDEYTKSLKKEPFNFRSIYKKSDLEAIEIARNDNLDIAIDLMAFTKNNRMQIFSSRVSPVQISYLHTTTGSNEIDYLIGDKVLIPEEFKKYYSEQILYMPNSFMCFDDTRKSPNKSFTRKEFNLPDDAFVMAAFHQNRKITIKEIESWSKILNHISNAILWISSANEIAEENILKAFKERDVNIDNILFAPLMETNEEHLSRHSCADLFIDTFNWNASSTAMDSLWVGLPIVTLLGKSYTARTSASLLTTLGLNELIAHTTQEYEDIIISLSKEPKKLREVKNKLLNSKYKNPLFNSKLFTEDFESICCNLVDNI